MNRPMLIKQNGRFFLKILLLKIKEKRPNFFDRRHFSNHDISSEKNYIILIKINSPSLINSLNV